jgi:hypothetical protein
VTWSSPSSGMEMSESESTSIKSSSFRGGMVYYELQSTAENLSRLCYINKTKYVDY